jgi:diguanylate cyclase (GGDEF)-like protein
VRKLIGLLIPGGVLVLAAWAVQQEEIVRTSVAPYTPFFCYGAGAAALLLSWYYDQSRLLCVAAAVLLNVWVVGIPNAPAVARLGAIFLLPLNFVLFASLRERGVVTFEGFIKIGVIAAQAYAVIWIGGTRFPPLEGFLGWGLQAIGELWLPIPALVVFWIAGLILLTFFFFRRTTVEPGLLWALGAMFLGTNANTPDALHLYGGAAALALVFAVLEHGYDIAYRDELTGLPGRRAFNNIMEQLGGTYALAMCDVDNFKQLNDTYGHETGDQILRMVAVKLSQVGGGGRAFRYGGEEFLLVFRGLSARDAQPYVEKVRSAIAGGGFVLRGPDRPARKPASVPRTGNRTTITITVSAGIAGRSQRHSSPELVLDAADAALYRAKEAGRNCVKLAESTPGNERAAALTQSPSAGAT